MSYETAGPHTDGENAEADALQKASDRGWQEMLHLMDPPPDDTPPVRGPIDRK